MFEICQERCCYIQLLFTTRHSPNILLNQTIPVKNPNNRFENMEMTEGGSYSMWNLPKRIRKGVAFARVIDKKATYSRSPNNRRGWNNRGGWTL